MKKEKVYTLVDKEEGNSSALQVVSGDFSQIIEQNKATTIILPVKVLDHFDRVGKIMKKHIASNNAIEILPSETNKSIKVHHRLNPLRLVSPMMMNTLLAPVAVFKMLGAIASTGELNKISGQIDALSEKINRLLIREQAQTYGKLSALISTLDLLETEYQATATFSTDMVIRLSLAQQELTTLSYTSKALVDSGEKILESAKGKKIKEIKTVINSYSNDYLFDRQVYLQSFKAQLQIGRLWLIHDLINKPNFVETRLSMIEKDVTLFSDNINQDDALQSLIGTFNEKYEKLSRFKKWRLGKTIEAKNDNEVIATTEFNKFLIVKERDVVKFITLQEEIGN